VPLSHIPGELAGSELRQCRAGDPAAGSRAGTGQDEAGSPADVLPQRRRLHARLAAVFLAGAGALGLVTLPLPAPGLNVVACVAVSVAALALGAAVWCAPWDVWPRPASLAILPPAFALVALANVYGGQDPHTYGIFFVVAFVWIGIAHPQLTSLGMAPVAAAAYMLPLLVIPGSGVSGLSAAALTIPVCVLVGEAIAWGTARLGQIELALSRERGRTEHLRELDAMKDAFLSAASHELRTPITICRGHLDVLEDRADGQELQGVKEILVDELDLMGRLVEDLTTLAWVGDGTQLRVETLPVHRFVSGISAKAGPILGDRLLVETDADGGTLTADPQRLTQAVVNLLRNAAVHGGNDRPVRFRVAAEPSSWRFEVADQGGGLPPGAAHLVFEPFTTGSPETGGTGLGLSIVRGIARAHGGDSGVASLPGHGATFWIRIPR
jgi:signal transduction histidine kinase